MYDNQRLLELITLLFKILFSYLLLEIACDAFDLYYLNILKNNGSVNSDLEKYWRIKSQFIYYGARFLPLIIGSFFIGWFYREYWNMQSIFAQYQFRYKPWAAILAFIIPIFNLFGPFLIMKEIVNGHEAYYNRRINQNYVELWWFSFLAHTIYSKIISFQKVVMVDEFISFTHHSLISNGLGVISLSFLILILKQLEPTLFKNSSN